MVINIHMRVARGLFSFSSRRLFIGGNWKSNNTLEQTKELVQTVINKIDFDPKAIGTSSPMQTLSFRRPSCTSRLSRKPFKIRTSR